MNAGAATRVRERLRAGKAPAPSTTPPQGLEKLVVRARSCSASWPRFFRACTDLETSGRACGREGAGAQARASTGASAIRRRRPSRSAARRAGDSAPIFVVQRHDARRLHYDFRLERDGALASWAVPNGVPLEPGEQHLAVHVEDHPLEYAAFEGEIPKGKYGAGTVEIWDRGTYELVEEKRDGGLTVRLDGERLQGTVDARPGDISAARRRTGC